MLCDRCKSKEACYHSTLIVNGNSQSTHLCEDCARKEGAIRNEPLDVFGSFIDDFASFGNSTIFEDLFCPTCNRNFNEYMSNGFLGCPDCFDIFKNDFEDLESEITPKRSLNNKDDIEFRTPQKSKLEKEIEELQQQLNSAVKDERYEDASEINKRIKELKNKNENK